MAEMERRRSDPQVLRLLETQARIETIQGGIQASVTSLSTRIAALESRISTLEQAIFVWTAKLRMLLMIGTTVGGLLVWLETKYSLVSLAMRTVLGAASS